MAAFPQIGATIAFDIDGDRLRHLKVIFVQHNIEVRTREVTTESREVLIRRPRLSQVSWRLRQRRQTPSYGSRSHILDRKIGSEYGSAQSESGHALCCY